MKITFWGAAETVTGSRFVVETDHARVLVDCGLFQGVKRLRLLNWERFPVDPASLDAVVLTHAHVDHSGYLPALVRDGFDGRIWCTHSSAALAGILLPDTAHLQEEDARYANKHRSTRHDPALPLFTGEDAERALDHLHPHPFDEPFEVAPGVEGRFSRAGHILGAASVRLDDGQRSVVFSGDLGRGNDQIMRPPAPPPAADHIVIESTYGNRDHPDEDPADVLAEVITRTAKRGGIVLIPVFAVGRAQLMIHLITTLRAAGRIPDIPVFLNSPMAIDATQLFLSSPEDHRLNQQQLDAMSRSVTLVRTVQESMELTSRSGPMVVLSASGMLTGGRVLHHLMQVGRDHRSTILLAGFQAAGTRGQQLQQGATSLRIYGQTIPIRADVVSLDSVSAHADADELMAWLASAPSAPSMVSVVHGEASAADTLRHRITTELGWQAWVPTAGESVTVERGGGSVARTVPVPLPVEPVEAEPLAPAPTPGSPTADEADAALVRDLWAALARRDFEAVGACMADHGHYVDVAVKEIDPGAIGPAETAARLRLGLGPLHGYELHDGPVVASGGTVVTEHAETWTWEPGVSVTLPFTSVMHVSHGKVDRWWDYFDLATLTDAAPAWWLEHIAQGYR
jgi:metallo-beta-lactamase family protein